MYFIIIFKFIAEETFFIIILVPLNSWNNTQADIWGFN